MKDKNGNKLVKIFLSDIFEPIQLLSFFIFLDPGTTIFKKQLFDKKELKIHKKNKIYKITTRSYCFQFLLGSCCSYCR